jgi:hypothetical protein
LENKKVLFVVVPYGEKMKVLYIYLLSFHSGVLHFDMGGN